MTSNHVRAAAVAFALAFPLAAAAQGPVVTAVAGKAPGERLKAGELQVRATVVEIDAARRIVTLRGPKGNIATMDVPAEVKNFDQVRVGDDLVIRYAAGVLAKLEPSSGSGIRERVESSSAAAAPAGGMPGGAAARTVEVLATVEAVNRKDRTVTLRGVRRTAVVMAPEGIDIARVKVGDQVRAVFAESTIINVERAAKK
jgi:hypothetical protein